LEEKTFTVYFLKEEIAHYILIPDGDVGILNCFDPETSLYLYGPVAIKREHHMQDITKTSYLSDACPFIL
jgi:hypothetical protein